MEHQYILSNLSNGVGHITLNSERTLNALNQTMAEELLSILDTWEKDSNISCIFLDGAGQRAFCAGGDIKNLYLALKNSPSTQINSTCLNFFITEYTLDYKIHTYSKPIISWNNGITMGGGMGLMNGASHKIVTETSLLSMPEVSIGLYPDVGATYFFNKIPPGVGKFLGVTAARIKAADAIQLGLADYYLADDQKDNILIQLRKLSWRSHSQQNYELIHNLLNNLSSPIPPSEVQQLIPELKKLEDVNSVRDFNHIAKNFPQNDWLQSSLETFRKGSPSSAAIILKQLDLGKNMDLREAFMSELNLSTQCSLKPDFFEGVRALLIDKDQNPNWLPAHIDDLEEGWVESYFTPLWNESNHPFKDWPLREKP